MKTRRPLASLLAVVTLLTSGATLAQAWPARPITLIVPFGAGGPTDIIFRIVAEGMKDALGQPLVIENRPGAGGGVGTVLIRDSKPDGYTLGGTGGGPVAVPHYTRAYANLDLIRQFSSISYVCYAPLLVMVHPSVPARNLRELVEQARANPGKLNWGAQNVAINGDLALLKRATGAGFEIIPYKGGGPMLNALAAGEIHVGRDVPGSAKAFLDGGRVRAIGIMSDQAWPGQPQLSTISELTGVTPAIPAWFGLHGPAGIPKPIVERLVIVTKDALFRPDIRRRLEELSFYVDGGGPEVLERRIRADNESHRAAREAGGLKPE